MIDVFFDYKDLGNKLQLGVVFKTSVTPDNKVGKTILQETKEIIKPAESNFYHWTIEAFLFAIDLVKEDSEEAVVFKNQQVYVFDWLIKGTYKEAYATYYDDLYNSLQEINDLDIRIEYEVISGEKNEAKKYMKKLAKKGSSNSKGSLNNIFNNSHKNVVSILNHARKKA